MYIQLATKEYCHWTTTDENNNGSYITYDTFPIGNNDIYNSYKATSNGIAIHLLLSLF